MMAEIPKMKMPKRATRSKVMKGRPITREEVERMLSKVRSVVAGPLLEKRTRLILRIARIERAESTETEGLRSRLCECEAEVAAVVSSWQRLLHGLWWSGLRLGEALNLWWNRDDALTVDFSDKYPMLRVRTEAEKAHQDRLLPIAPEFAEFFWRSCRRDATAAFSTRSRSG